MAPVEFYVVSECSGKSNVSRMNSSNTKPVVGNTRVNTCICKVFDLIKGALSVRIKKLLVIYEVSISNRSEM